MEENEMTLEINKTQSVMLKTYRLFMQDIYISLIKNQDYKHMTNKEMAEYSFKLALNFYKHALPLMIDQSPESRDSEKKYYGYLFGEENG